MSRHRRVQASVFAFAATIAVVSTACGSDESSTASVPTAESTAGDTGAVVDSAVDTVVDTVPEAVETTDAAAVEPTDVADSAPTVADDGASDGHVEIPAEAFNVGGFTDVAGPPCIIDLRPGSTSCQPGTAYPDSIGPWDISCSVGISRDLWGASIATDVERESVEISGKPGYFFIDAGILGVWDGNVACSFEPELDSASWDSLTIATEDEVVAVFSAAVDVVFEAIPEVQPDDATFTPSAGGVAPTATTSG